MLHRWMPWILFSVLAFTHVRAFLPHPIIAYGVRSSQSITHAEITQLGIIRSLARFFYDTRLAVNSTNGTLLNKEKFLTTEHTVDDLYHLAYPDYNSEEIYRHSLPLKFTTDYIMTHDALVDFDERTKLLATAHFDDEAFANSSRRILQLRALIVNETRGGEKSIAVARRLLGHLLHTLQDFYSHSNWVEMGKTDINELIGVSEIIGSVAAPNQSTCTNDGCSRLEKTCTLWQQLTLNVCPLVYYDCQNNILPEILEKQLLTSGYYAHDHDENNTVIRKPTDVVKCSHGSVMDASSHVPAMGGINKDSYNLILSPHSNLHKQAANLAVKATERFLNDLRRDIGDGNFDRLLAINPTATQSRTAADSVSQGRRFRLFTPSACTSLKNDDSFAAKVRRFFQTLRKMIGQFWSGSFFEKDTIDQPTYNLSDHGVNVTDASNHRAVPYIIGSNEQFKRKKRLIAMMRQRR